MIIVARITHEINNCTNKLEMHEADLLFNNTEGDKLLKNS